MALNSRTDRVMVKLGNFTAKSMVALTFEVKAVLSETTPKATSWASNNWIGAIGQPSREVFGDPITDPTAGIAAGNQSLASIAASYKITSGNIFVSNNVPYIQPLNAGHSKKAPSGFIQLGVITAIDRTNQKRIAV